MFICTWTFHCHIKYAYTRKIMNFYDSSYTTAHRYSLWTVFSYCPNIDHMQMTWTDLGNCPDCLFFSCDQARHWSSKTKHFSNCIQQQWVNYSIQGFKTLFWRNSNSYTLSILGAIKVYQPAPFSNLRMVEVRFWPGYFQSVSKELS